VLARLASGSYRRQCGKHMPATSFSQFDPLQKSHPFKMPLSIVATNARILTPCWREAASLVLDIDIRQRAFSQSHSHLNARLLAILNALYKIDYLSDPSAARTIEAVSIAWIVVFAVVRGETVPLGRRISMPQIYMKPTFD